MARETSYFPHVYKTRIIQTIPYHDITQIKSLHGLGKVLNPVSASQNATNTGLCPTFERIHAFRSSTCASRSYVASLDPASTPSLLTSHPESCVHFEPTGLNTLSRQGMTPNPRTRRRDVGCMFSTVGNVRCLIVPLGGDQGAGEPRPTGQGRRRRSPHAAARAGRHASSVPNSASQWNVTTPSSGVSLKRWEVGLLQGLMGAGVSGVDR